MSLFILGRALPPIEQDKQKFIPVWQQEARNENGGKKFHGAFTGGFEAGFHNTVGSKEGWIPSTFHSSRESRAERKTANIEDFMDDEDIKQMKGNDLNIRPCHDDTGKWDGEIKGEKVVKRKKGWEIVRILGYLETEKGADDPLKYLLSFAKKRHIKSLDRVAVDSDEEHDPFENKKETFVSIDVGERGEKVMFSKQQSTLADYKVDCLKGFVPASRQYLEKAVEVDNSVKVPTDWKPTRKYNESLNTSTITQPVTKILSAEDRAIILGEQPAVSYAPQSISIDVFTATSAQTGFMPYSAIPLKDSRYKAFLAHYADPINYALPPILPNMTMAEYRREQEEFTKAALLYSRNASSSSRFVTSSKALDVTIQKGGLHKPSISPAAPSKNKRFDVKPANEVVSPLSKKEDSNNYKVPNYGTETKKVSKWSPSSIICRLFGVKFENHTEPEPTPKIKPVLSKETMKEIISSSMFSDQVDTTAFEDDPVAEEMQSVMQLPDLEERPGLDLFLSIFGEEPSAPKTIKLESNSSKKISKKKPASFSAASLLEEEEECINVTSSKRKYRPSASDFM